MDVDQKEENNTGTSKLLALPHIVENEVLDSKNPKETMIEMLDMLETHVERLRKEAAVLEEEKDRILASLDSICNADSVRNVNANDLDDILRYADRIVTRVHTVEIRVHTQRDRMQEEALFQINHYIDGLIMSIREDPDGTKSRCQAFMNACSSHYIHGITDKNFESALLGCTLDDQKRVKKRLQGLLHYIAKLEMEMNIM